MEMLTQKLLRPTTDVDEAEPSFINCQDIIQKTIEENLN